MSEEVTLSEIELKSMFEQNFERLKIENGHSLSEEVKNAAWLQIKMYWEKLRDIAEKVTETEVALTLSNIETNNGIKYNIEGVVDIVRQDEKITLYDFKTDDPAHIKTHKEFYAEQLNIYAYIWEGLKEENLSETSIIATRLTEELSNAIKENDLDRIREELINWDPIISIPHDTKNVSKTIKKFSATVENIESHKFKSPGIDRLENREGLKSKFGTRVCRNCDARFSCFSYRIYAINNKDSKWAKFSDFYDLREEEDFLDRVDAYIGDGSQSDIGELL